MTINIGSFGIGIVLGILAAILIASIAINAFIYIKYRKGTVVINEDNKNEETLNKCVRAIEELIKGHNDIAETLKSQRNSMEIIAMKLVENEEETKYSHERIDELAEAFHNGLLEGLKDAELNKDVESAEAVKEEMVEDTIEETVDDVVEETVDDVVEEVIEEAVDDVDEDITEELGPITDNEEIEAAVEEIANELLENDMLAPYLDYIARDEEADDDSCIIRDGDDVPIGRMNKDGEVELFDEYNKYL